jgi:hypothetical protein
MMAQVAANGGPAAHRDRPEASTRDQAGPSGQSEPGGRREPSPLAREAEQAPPANGLSSSIAFLLEQLHDAAAARDGD